MEVFADHEEGIISALAFLRMIRCISELILIPSIRKETQRSIQKFCFKLFV
jgi:hypothetical protein